MAYILSKIDKLEEIILAKTICLKEVLKIGAVLTSKVSTVV